MTEPSLFEKEIQRLFDDLNLLICPELRPENPRQSDLFRLLHSIKSLAALGGFKPLEEASHALESAFLQGSWASFLQDFESYRKNRLPSPEDFEAAKFEDSAEFFRKSDPEETHRSKNAFVGSASDASYAIKLPNWELAKQDFERLVVQEALSRKLILFSAWVYCPEDSALLRLRLLMSQAEDNFWILACRFTVKSKEQGGAASSWYSRVFDSYPEALEQAKEAYLEFLCVDRYGRRDSWLKNLPDQIYFPCFRDFSSQSLSETSDKRACENLEYYLGFALPSGFAENPASLGSELLRNYSAGLKLRLTPVAQLAEAFEKAFYTLMQDRSLPIQLLLSVEEVLLPEAVSLLLADALAHLLRNVFAHCKETIQERRSLYKPDSLMLELRIFKSDQDIVCVLNDDGPGISSRVLGFEDEADIPLQDQDLLPWLVRTQNSEAAEANYLSGRGVGLSSAAHIVQNSLYGTVRAYSKGTGQGSSFMLRFSLDLVEFDFVLATLGDLVFAIPRCLLRHFKGEVLKLDAKSLEEQKLWENSRLQFINAGPGKEDQPLRGALLFDSGSKALWVDRLLGYEKALLKPGLARFYSLRLQSWLDILKP